MRPLPLPLLPGLSLSLCLLPGRASHTPEGRKQQDKMGAHPAEAALARATATAQAGADAAAATSTA